MKKRILKVISGILAAAVFTASAVGSLSAQPGAAPDWSTLSVWAESDIKEAYELGILQPDMAKDFQTELTREQFCDACVMVLSLWQGCDFRDTENDPELKTIADKADFQGFSDTSVRYVEFCAKLGIVGGMGDGTFAPDSSITREQAARMLYNTLEIGTDIISDAEADDEYGVNGIFIPHIFNDGSKIDSWARYEIYTMYNLGIMTGDTENNFDPLGTYTREQAYCTFLRLYKAEAAPDELDAPTPEAWSAAKNNLNISSKGTSTLSADYLWGTADYEYEPLYYDGYGGVHKAADEGYGYIYPFDQEYMTVITATGAGVYSYVVIDKYKNEYDSYDSIERKQEETVYENEFTVEYASEEKDGNFKIVDINGNTVKEFYLDPDVYVVVYLNGTNMILRNPDNSSQLFLYKADSGEFVDRDYKGMYFNKEGYIIAYKTYRWIETEFDCYFLDKEGNIIYDLGSMGYKGLWPDSNYDLKSCLLLLRDDKEQDGLKHYDVMTMDGRIIKQNITGTEIIVSDDGIYAYEVESSEIRFFDDKGNDLGSVVTDGDIKNGGIRFISGLLNAQTENGYYYYTPFGEEALKKAWTIYE
ncbi:MAG: S-layer homology domain-containing protein [Clostridiales bacterium]|nr:S-layer homology domain-containing protein [Clostridiales bacterium]